MAVGRFSIANGTAVLTHERAGQDELSSGILAESTRDITVGAIKLEVGGAVAHRQRDVVPTPDARR